MQQLRVAWVPGVQLVWCPPPELGNRLLVVIAIEQDHQGHSLPKGLVGGQVAATVYGGCFVVDGAWSSRLDLAVDPSERGRDSRLILDATRRRVRRHEFPEPVTGRERAHAIRQRWGWLLRRNGNEEAR